METTHLQQMMVAMVQYKPELAKSTPADVSPSLRTSSHVTTRPGSLYSSFDAAPSASRNPSVSSRRSFYGIGNGIGSGDYSNGSADNDADEDDDIQVGHHFTYIPPNPKRFYKRLLEICLLADLEVMLSPEVDDNDEVSLGILSAPHIDLLNECAMRWRISHSYRVTCFMDIVRQFYERGDVPLECIPEGLSNIQKAMTDMELENWPTQDVSCSFSFISQCSEFVLRADRIFVEHLWQPLQHLSVITIPRHGFHTEPQTCGSRALP